MPKPANNPSLISFFNSIKYAFKGIKHVFKNERNFRLHVLSAVLVFILAFYFKCDLLELSLLVIVVSIVLIAEIINSAIEYTWDKLEPRNHPVVGMIKDMMAGSVMLASIMAFIVGLLVAIRHII
jgi:undecaprenol kinase